MNGSFLRSVFFSYRGLHSFIKKLHGVSRLQQRFRKAAQNPIHRASVLVAVLICSLFNVLGRIGVFATRIRLAKRIQALLPRVWFLSKFPPQIPQHHFVFNLAPKHNSFLSNFDINKETVDQYVDYMWSKYRNNSRD